MLLNTTTQNLYLYPPYCPQFNPIENVFSMIKNYFRRSNIINKNKLISSIDHFKKVDLYNFYKNSFITQNIV